MAVGLIGFVVGSYLFSQSTKPLTTIIKGKEIRYEDIKREKYISKPFEEDEKWIYIIATAYTKDGQECGKRIGDGITASGKRASVDRGTIACPQDIPFETKIYIPKLDRIFINMDRGNKKYIKWINGKMRIDIYFENKQKAINFGVKEFKAKIIK